MPADLLPDRGVSVQAKLLYAGLQRMGRARPAGPVHVRRLCAQAGTSPNTAKRAARALQAAGWVE